MLRIEESIKKFLTNPVSTLTVETLHQSLCVWVQFVLYVHTLGLLCEIICKHLNFSVMKLGLYCTGRTWSWMVWVRTGYPVLGSECWRNVNPICKGLAGCLCVIRLVCDCRTLRSTLHRPRFQRWSDFAPHNWVCVCCSTSLLICCRGEGVSKEKAFGRCDWIWCVLCKQHTSTPIIPTKTLTTYWLRFKNLTDNFKGGWRVVVVVWISFCTLRRPFFPFLLQC